MRIFETARRIHFIGIGGISMSGLAAIMLHAGYIVTGSDMNDSKIIRKLQQRGAEITLGHDAHNVEGSDLVVYTAAVKQDNPEIIRAKELHIPIVDRAEFLGSIMKNYNYGIAIAGMHGKTTTTSLTSIIFKNAALDPTILIGGELDAIKGNVLVGDSEYFITEACEYVESFLKFHPFIGAVLNIEEEHLDYFENLDHIMTAFEKFIRLIPEEGCLVVCANSANAIKAAKAAKCRVITYGLQTAADFVVNDIKYNADGYPYFDVWRNNELLGTFSLNVLGSHNVLNSIAAIAIATYSGISTDIIKTSLLEYKGTHRRFDVQGSKNNITIIDDYAHHPTEIKATLEAAKQYPHKRIFCIFQPHTYSRLKTLFNDFTTAFYGVDKVIVTDIYSAREKNTGDVHSMALVNGINQHSNNAVYNSSFSEIVDIIAAEAKPGDIVFTMGAGDIYMLGDMLLERL